MKQPRKRCLGGVCEAIGSEYKNRAILVRILFLVTTYFFIFPALVYSILCFTIKNYQKVESKLKIRYNFVGFLIGLISFTLILFIYFYNIINTLPADMKKFNDFDAYLYFIFLFGGGVLIIALIIAAIVAVIIGCFSGGILGLIIGRSILERKEINKIAMPII
ncbi:PspC domain-containing protein [Algibacter sp.]|nr:PspC domain-containing protein [Algibacter sp.]